jgi:4-alpha-glucanotransferase
VGRAPTASVGRISLALVLHNHQPVGNFPWVVEEVFERAYEPMVAALEEHPTIRLALHYSGPLLEWIDANQPTFIDRLRTLVEREQVEILGGAYFEPILVALPEGDRQGQLRRMHEDVERRFGRPPAGAWLAERVWEPSLPTDLVDAGYEYTVLDDNHLRGASVKEDAMWGTYTTDDQGRRLTIFGTEKGLRYRIPWRPVAELIDYLRLAATADGARLGVMGDDGEKMGGWPGTYELCWGKEAWVEECFAALEREADWLSTVTPSQWLARAAPIGRIYVPTSSYVEMTEWALPPDEAPIFHELLQESSEAGSPLAHFLRGGTWRNFQARYREINEMHKQMLRVSSVVAALPAGPAREAATEHLYRGQSNDCYWHGLFGGVYLVHMRMATLAELIAAEDVALGDSAAYGTADYDLDGRDEVLIGTLGQTVLVDPAEAGAISAWDLRASRSALASVLRRRPEAYHELLRRHDAAAESPAAKTISPHELVQVKEEGLSALLVYDRDERRSGLVRFVVDGAEQGDWARAAWVVERASESEVVLSRSEGSVSVSKSILLGGDRLGPTLTIGLDIAALGRGVKGELVLEWNLNLQGGGANPAAYYKWGKREVRHDSIGRLAARGAALSFGNTWMDVEVRSTAQPAAARDWYPVETVSNSEGGFERVYQGSCLAFRWPLGLAAGKRATFVARLEVRQGRDRRIVDGK